MHQVPSNLKIVKEEDEKLNMSKTSKMKEMVSPKKKKDGFLKGLKISRNSNMKPVERENEYSETNTMYVSPYRTQEEGSN